MSKYEQIFQINEKGKLGNRGRCINAIIVLLKESIEYTGSGTKRKGT